MAIKLIVRANGIDFKCIAEVKLLLRYAWKAVSRGDIARLGQGQGQGQGQGRDSLDCVI